MELSYKDAITTVLAGTAGALTYAAARGWQGWFPSTRVGVLMLGLVGIGMCAFGATNVEKGGLWVMALSILGGTAFVLIVAGLITGSKSILYVLGLDILVLWLLSTLRHALGT
jgi:hypothetical protein